MKCRFRFLSIYNNKEDVHLYTIIIRKILSIYILKDWELKSSVDNYKQKSVN